MAHQYNHRQDYTYVVITIQKVSIGLLCRTDHFVAFSATTGCSSFSLSCWRWGSLWPMSALTGSWLHAAAAADACCSPSGDAICTPESDDVDCGRLLPLLPPEDGARLDDDDAPLKPVTYPTFSATSLRPATPRPFPSSVKRSLWLPVNLDASVKRSTAPAFTTFCDTFSN